MEQGLLRVNSAEASSCSQGQQWNSNLGRCLTDVETAKVMQATANCDPKDVACYKENAKAAFDKDVAAGKAEKAKGNNKFMSTVGNAGAVAGSVMSVVTWMNTTPDKCAAVSHSMIIAGGVTTFVGEMFANSKHKKNLKGIEKDWDKIVNTNFDGTDKDSKKAHSSAAQAEAFEMMAKAEDSIADNAKTKNKIHMAAAAMYAAAGIAAGLEIIAAKGTMGASKAQSWCGTSPATFNTSATDLMYASTEYDHFQSLKEDQEFTHFLSLNAKKHYFESNAIKDNFESIFTLYSSQNNQFSSPSLDEFQATKRLVLDEESQVTVKNVLKIILTNINPLPASAHAAFDMGGLKTLMEKPYTRLGFSVVLGGWSLIMMKHTKSQEEASRNRAEHLRKMKAEFEGASSALNMCAPQDRSNTSKPECYCYTPEGQRNSSRSNSQICQKLWSGELAAAKEYKNSNNAFTGCISSTNQYDAACACKKSSKGCLTVSTKGVSGISTGALSLLNSGVSPVNDIASGNFAKGTASDEAILNNAMRTMKAVDKMMDQEPIKSQIKDKDKFLAGIETAVQKATGGGNYDGLANNFSGDAASAVASLEKEIDKSSTKVKKASSPTQVAGPAASKKSQGFSFDLGQDNDQEKINDQVAQVMNQDFDYAQNDINQSQTNLFELLSNRYQRSGMRRLFDEEGRTAPETASNTDINN